MPKARPDVVNCDEVETTLVNANESMDGGKATRKEAEKDVSNGNDFSSPDASNKLISATNQISVIYPDVGRSADLYASVVLQKLPQVFVTIIALMYLSATMSSTSELFSFGVLAVSNI